MAVEARLYVAEVKMTAYGSQQNPSGTIVLRASTRGEENKSWAAATPSAEFTLHTCNPAAFEWLKGRLAQDLRILIDDVPGE